MESGFTAAGEETILEADRELEADIETGRSKSYSSAKELFDDLKRKK